MVRQQVVEVVAEMVANVLGVSTAEGELVEVGDEVCLLESMKMEIPVIVETTGVVVAVKVQPGDVVQEGTVMLELNPVLLG